MEKHGASPPTLLADLVGLERAARVAYASDPSKHHFVRSRELCDPTQGVRVFEFMGETWFLKSRSGDLANREILNSSRMARLFDGVAIEGVTFKVGEMHLVSLPEGEAAVISRDLGPTLHSTRAYEGLEPILAKALEMLLIAGVEWKGFIPRNLIYDLSAKSITMIDFESAIFHERARPMVKSSTRLKLKLNWMQVWPAEGVLLETIEDMRVRQPIEIEDLDDFEKTMIELCGDVEEVPTLVERCDAATITAEAPEPSLDEHLTPMEIGHALDEAMDDRVSVFLVFLFASIRRASSSKYAALMRDLGRELLRRDGCYDQASLRHAVCAALDAAEGSGQAMEALTCIRSLDTAQGLDAALRRSQCLDRLLGVLERCIWRAFPFLTPAELILRGSGGQGVLSRKSDIDFELSSRERPDGWPEIEALVVEILALLGLEAEGSLQRPEEQDLIGLDGLTRDANEWSQLRRPGSDGGPPNWLKDIHPHAERNWWRMLSRYEASLTMDEAASPAYLFKAARATAARAAASLGCRSAMLAHQLEHIAKVQTLATALAVREAVERAVIAREAASLEKEEILAQMEDISDLCGALTVPDPFFAVKAERSKVAK